ncbi:MAG: NUDIX domain-containing protein [Bacteroidota bacterium]
MNKKIYFNNKFILLQSAQLQSSEDQSLKIFRENSPENIKKIINDFLSTPGGNSIQIVTDDAGELFKNLKKIFYYIEAAGGFIEKNDKYLFIHRHGRWDLPKGKLEKAEAIEKAAVRECEEETGVKELSISHPLSSTFHIYAYKNAYALKQTYWFYMQTTYNGELQPQLEEDIDEVKWFDKNSIVSFVLNDTYFTISDIIREGLRLQ